MKLLFDQNLSPDLCRRLNDIYPDSDHVFRLGLDQTKDTEICKFAVENDFTIVTKDADYSEWISLYAYSPKIIWIRKGNCSTAATELLLRENHEQAKVLAEKDNIRLLMLF